MTSLAFVGRPHGGRLHGRLETDIDWSIILKWILVE
jgi:hypothetical protein